MKNYIKTLTSGSQLKLSETAIVNPNEHVGKRTFAVLATCKKLAVVISFFVLGTNFMHAQSLNDTASILQLSLDLKGIQSYYPMNKDKSYREVSILEFPVSFPENIGITKFNRPVLFLSRGDVYANKPDAYFTFQEFSITDTTAKVNYEILYNINKKPLKRVSVDIQLQKAATTWGVTNFKITNEQ